MPLIKRYPNRKLYNTETKEYITLEGVAALICQGQEVCIIDHTTGEDLTTLILTQIISEQARRQSGSAAIPLFTQLIRAGRQRWESLFQDIIASSPGWSIDGMIHRALERHNIPTRKDLERITNELETLRTKIEQFLHNKKESPTSLVGPLTEIILYVQNMAQQVSFYRDKLGLKVVYTTEAEDYATFDTGTCRLALHAGGKDQQKPDNPRVVFEVQDIRAVRRELLHRGVHLSDIRSAAPGVWVCDGQDPEGNHFSLEARD